MSLDLLTDRLETIRRKRNALIASPRARAYIDESPSTLRKNGARASLAAVAEIEARCGITLPIEYRRFITEIADGGYAPGCGMFSVQEAVDDAPEWTGSLSAPFCYGAADALRALERRASGDRFYSLDQPNEDGLPGGSLLLAHTGCGCFDILVVTGEQRGTVWFHDVQRLIPYSYGAAQMTFFDWYEGWADAILKRTGESA